MVNKGFEVNFSYRKYEGDFHYSFSGNLTTLKNEVTQIGPTNLPREEPTSRTEVGRSMGELYGFVVEGVFQSDDEINRVQPDNAAFDPNRQAFQHAQTQPGDFKFKDIDGDGQITLEGDRDYLGTVIPKITYGINASFDYKGFDLSIFFVGIAGNKVYNDVYKVANQLGEGNYSVESYNNYWREETEMIVPDPSTGEPVTVTLPARTGGNTYPRPTVVDNNENRRVSSAWVQNGSYFRLQNLMLGYTIPMDRVAAIDNLRIYVQAQNLITFTKLYGYDPDFINDGNFNRGLSNGSYPSPTTFSIGVKLGL
jgi:hypothetical protein